MFVSVRKDREPSWKTGVITQLSDKGAVET